MDNLINDIRNVFNNSGSKNQPILKQGKQFIRYADDYVKVVKPELKIIQQTTSPKLKSIVETLESTNSLSQTNKVPVSNVSQFESEFNRTLVEYSNAYKSFMQELLNKTQTQKKVNQFFGKAVSSADGNYAYVNDFGYTHRYSNDAWLKNDPSCPNTVSPISADDFKSLVQGPDMGLGQACKIAGQNIQNTDTEEVAWVDIKGYKHIYPVEIWKSKESSCNLEPIKISKIAFNNIPSGTPMTNTSLCNKMDLNPVLLGNLNELNNKLVSLAQSMISELNNITVNDKDLNNKLTQKKNELKNYINEFNNQKSSSFSENDMITLEGERQNSNSYLNYSYYRFIVWFIFLIFIILFILKNLVSNESSNLESVIVILFVIFIIYYVSKKVF